MNDRSARLVDGLRSERIGRFLDVHGRCTGAVQQALVRFAPAAVLGWLGVVQSLDALHGAVLIASNPDWSIAVDVMREILYGSFMVGAAVALLRSKGPRLRDRRAPVEAAALSASFLLVVVGLFPRGPMAWVATVRTYQTGLLTAAVGASLAVAALVSLGSNFSIVPEARSLVVTGPYRWIRHPMYLAEILMMTGVVLSDPRVAYLMGAIGVCGLQLYRIRVEEQLLAVAHPDPYKQFTAQSRYRLLPGVW